MLKSNKGYNLASDVKKKISTTFAKIMAVILLTTTLATAPAILSSCGQDVAVNECLPSVSVKEMNEYVAAYFKFPPVGSLSNPTSLAYSMSVSDGRVYELNIVSTSKEQAGQVPVYLTTLIFPQGISQKEIERKKTSSLVNFSNSTIKTFQEGEYINLEEIYSSSLGEDYIIAMEYEQPLADGIEV